MKDTIQALIALARAETPQETMAALASCRLLLGAAENPVDFHALLDSLTARATQVHTLRRLAACDALTGIANRRGFEDALEQWVALHNGSRTGLAVVLLDLDGLKQLNDTQGHAAGDEAIVAVARTCESTLQGSDQVACPGGNEAGHVQRRTAGEEAVATVASTCESTLRGTDLVARWVGDEFAVLLPAATRSDAEVVARRLRAAIQSQVVAGRHLRVSVGIAAAAVAAVSARGLLAGADADLYRDKRAPKAASSRQAA